MQTIIANTLYPAAFELAAHLSSKSLPNNTISEVIQSTNPESITDFAKVMMNFTTTSITHLRSQEVRQLFGKNTVSTILSTARENSNTIATVAAIGFSAAVINEIARRIPGLNRQSPTLRVLTSLTIGAAGAAFVTNNFLEGNISPTTLTGIAMRVFTVHVVSQVTMTTAQCALQIVGGSSELIAKVISSTCRALSWTCSWTKWGIGLPALPEHLIKKPVNPEDTILPEEICQQFGIPTGQGALVSELNDLDRLQLTGSQLAALGLVQTTAIKSPMKRRPSFSRIPVQSGNENKAAPEGVRRRKKKVKTEVVAQPAPAPVVLEANLQAAASAHSSSEEESAEDSGEE